MTALTIRIRLVFQDEARIGQKGRVCHIWWKRGERPPGLCDKRFTFAYIFAAVGAGYRQRFSDGAALCRYGGDTSLFGPLCGNHRR